MGVVTISDVYQIHDLMILRLKKSDSLEEIHAYAMLFSKLGCDKEEM